MHRALAFAGHDGPLTADDFRAADVQAPPPLRPTAPPPRDTPAAPEDAGVHFSAEVRALAAAALRDGDIPRTGGSERRDRALVRAALLCLRSDHPGQASGPGLSSLARRVFRTGWSTALGGRGMAELLDVLGTAPGDERARAWIVARVGA